MIFIIVTMLRILGVLAVGTAQSFAVMVGRAWFDSMGKFHWRS